MRFKIFVYGFAVLSLGQSALASSSIEQLGELMFNDQHLSQPNGQACLSCHSPTTAFTDPSGGATSRGANTISFGNRNAPTIAYMKFSKPLTVTTEEGESGYEGGLFWDGRASSLEEQAKGPLLNPIEMGSTQEYVVGAVCNSENYGSFFKSVFGDSVCDTMLSFGLPGQVQVFNQIEKAFDSIASAIASYERTDVFAPFTSKFDRVIASGDTFTTSEQRGYSIFNNTKTANCVGCHVLEKDNSSGQPLFTDFSYDNLGVPINPEIQAPESRVIDIGLSRTSLRDEDKGRFKVPTLRNIAQTTPYMHNGYFKTLKQVVDFYNTRDTKAVCASLLSADYAEQQNCWPEAEVSETVNHKELGNLKLTDQDVDDLVAFMETLSDGYTPAKN